MKESREVGVEIGIISEKIRKDVLEVLSRLEGSYTEVVNIIYLPVVGIDENEIIFMEKFVLYIYIYKNSLLNSTFMRTLHNFPFEFWYFFFPHFQAASISLLIHMFKIAKIRSRYSFITREILIKKPKNIIHNKPHNFSFKFSRCALRASSSVSSL